MYNDVSETKAATTAAQAKAAEGGGTRNKDRLERDKKNYSDVQNARCENNEMPPLSSGSGIARTYSYENTIFFLYEEDRTDNYVVARVHEVFGTPRFKNTIT